jgi:hypothetical protein
MRLAPCMFAQVSGLVPRGALKLWGFVERSMVGAGDLKSPRGYGSLV